VPAFRSMFINGPGTSASIPAPNRASIGLGAAPRLSLPSGIRNSVAGVPADPRRGEFPGMARPARLEDSLIHVPHITQSPEHEIRRRQQTLR
jgi:hypothetical protein